MLESMTCVQVERNAGPESSSSTRSLQSVGHRDPNSVEIFHFFVRIITIRKYFRLLKINLSTKNKNIIHRQSFIRPESMTKAQSSTVMDVSAKFVDTIIFLTPGLGRIKISLKNKAQQNDYIIKNGKWFEFAAYFCSSLLRDEWSGRRMHLPPTGLVREFLSSLSIMMEISASPGRKTRIDPSSPFSTIHTMMERISS